MVMEPYVEAWIFFQSPNWIAATYLTILVLGFLEGSRIGDDGTHKESTPQLFCVVNFLTNIFNEARR
jgi:hypothetical protein